MISQHKHGGYVVEVVMETPRGWSAALIDYGSKRRYKQLCECYGQEIPEGEEKAIIATCGHHHRWVESCQPCFNKLQRKMKRGDA